VNYKTFSFELIRLYYIVLDVSLFLAHPVEMSIIQVALSHCWCRTTVQCQQNQFVTTSTWWQISTETGAQIKHSTLSDRIREWHPEQNGLQFSAEDGKRRRVPNVLR